MNSLDRILTDKSAEPLHKEGAAHTFFTKLHGTLGEKAPLSQPELTRASNPKLRRAAEYLREHFMQPVNLEENCAVANLSSPYLIRSFKTRYGMTPHVLRQSTHRVLPH